MLCFLCSVCYYVFLLFGVAWVIAVLSRKPDISAKLCRVLFGIILMSTTLAAGLWCKIVSVLPGTPVQRSNNALAGTRALWKLCFTLCPWVDLQSNNDDSPTWARLGEHLKKEDALVADGKASRPMFMLSNHTSFLDTLVGVTMLPPVVASRTRTYMGAHLFKLPVLATICRVIGHFPVYFAKSEYGKFTVEKDKMEEVQKKVDAHLLQGGQLAFFPEGQMNKTPDELSAFRYGAFKKALEFDARLWAFTTVNLEKAWPIKEQIGGWPAKCMYDIQVLAPDGCKALVAKLRAENPTIEEEDYALLAVYCHDRMQEARDSMKAKQAKEKAA